MDRSGVIFGNRIDRRTLRSAVKSKARYIRKYGDDSGADYKIGYEAIPALDFLGAKNMVFKQEAEPLEPKKSVIVGNIRMGFGHYRISIAMASCAKALGYTPYWLDLASFDATGSKMICEQNAMYSLASRISQKSRLFNHFAWEPLNREGFKALTYNAKDQKRSELLVPVFNSIPKETPYIATHVWPAQAAVHAGMKNVVNAVPDNWPMALHLAEGSIHAVQTPFAFLGYKTLDGFAKNPLKGIPESQIKMVGHYIDHELLENLEEDNSFRIKRAENGKPVRFLFTVGGAGAGSDMFLAMAEHLLPYVKKGQASLFINFGDHKDVYEKFCAKARLGNMTVFFNDYEKLKDFAKRLRSSDPEGIFAICSDDIFQAVYSTNLLIPEIDWLVTKPSELSYYPVPKIFMRHIGGHEVYGAVHSQEFGDGTFECPTAKSIRGMLDRVLSDKDILVHFAEQINILKSQGFYNGAYECVRLASGEF